eukprot:88261_1
MSDVLQRCRRLGFPLFIKTNKKIGDLTSVELLWLFYYLVEIYEPSWSHSPTGFNKSNYKPLSNAMRLLELGHKCPKAKELKRPPDNKRSIASSLSAVLDKLEAKFGSNKLYVTRFQHPSIKGMQPKKKNTKKNKTKTQNHNNATNKRIPIPRATSKDLQTVSYAVAHESKSEETHESMNKQHEEQKAMECEPQYDTQIETEDVIMNEPTQVNEERKEILQPINDLMNYNYKACDLNAYEFKMPKCRNETVQFHVEMQRNDAQLTMTEKYEQLQRQQSEKAKKINEMKNEYESIAQELHKCYSFQAKSFQNTSSTDYGLFQLESIKQKLKSQQELMHEKTPIPMDEDGIDRLLNSLSNEVQTWSNHGTPS